MKGIFLLYLIPIVLSNVSIQIFQEDAHDQIQDIIRHFKNLTDQQESISLFHTDSYFNTNCIKDALTPILSECIKKSSSELDQKERAFTAAKLSLCEFQVAKISYPKECDSFDMNNCITAMERKSQWWTSYSGYYRSIGEICHHESLPYEKNQILNMFLDVTNHYEQVLKFLKDYISKTESFKEESDVSFKKLIQLMNVMNFKTQESQLEIQKVWDIIKIKLFEATEVSMNVTDIIMVQNNNITKTMMEFFEQTTSEFDETLELLKLKFFKDLKLYDQAMLNSIEKTQKYIESFYDISSQNEIQSRKLNKYLKSNVKLSFDLNSTINDININTKDIIGDINNIKGLMNDVSLYFEGNPLAKIMMYVFGVLNWDWEVILLFISLTTLCFLIFYCLNSLFFKIIGIFISSLTTGYILLCWFLLITGNLNSQEEHIITDIST